MPRTYRSVVEDLNDLVRTDSVITITWDTFIKLNDTSRMKQSRLDDIQKVAAQEYSLIIGYGAAVICVCHDRKGLEIQQE